VLEIKDLIVCIKWCTSFVDNDLHLPLPRPPSCPGSRGCDAPLPPYPPTQPHRHPALHRFLLPLRLHPIVPDQITHRRRRWLSPHPTARGGPSSSRSHSSSSFPPSSSSSSSSSTLPLEPSPSFPPASRALPLRSRLHFSPNSKAQPQF
jgi:hypothetical protein